MNGRRWVRFAAMALLGTAALGCYSRMYCRDPGQTPPGMNQCIGGGGATEAVVTGVAAGALWAAGGGCKIAGCQPPLVCNRQSGLCERAFCGEGFPECPPGTSCDAESRRCY